MKTKRTGTQLGTCRELSCKKPWDGGFGFCVEHRKQLSEELQRNAKRSMFVDRPTHEIPCVDCGADIIAYVYDASPRCGTDHAHYYGVCDADCPLKDHGPEWRYRLYRRASARLDALFDETSLPNSDLIVAYWAYRHLLVNWKHMCKSLASAEVNAIVDKVDSESSP